MNTQNVLSTARRLFDMDAIEPVLTNAAIFREAIDKRQLSRLGWEGFHAGVRFAEQHYKIGTPQ